MSSHLLTVGTVLPCGPNGSENLVHLTGREPFVCNVTVTVPADGTYLVGQVWSLDLELVDVHDGDPDVDAYAEPDPDAGKESVFSGTSTGHATPVDEIPDPPAAPTEPPQNGSTE